MPGTGDSTVSPLTLLVEGSRNFQAEHSAQQVASSGREEGDTSFYVLAVSVIVEGTDVGASLVIFLFHLAWYQITHGCTCTRPLGTNASKSHKLDDMGAK